MAALFERRLHWRNSLPRLFKVSRKFRGHLTNLSLPTNSISVAERVKIIIAGHLLVNVAQLKATDDFEVGLGTTQLMCS